MVPLKIRKNEGEKETKKKMVESWKMLSEKGNFVYVTNNERRKNSSRKLEKHYSGNKRVECK